MTSLNKSIRIGDKIIDENSPCFIIAELSANHNGSLETALETIRAARRAGADAIKFQTYTADTLTIRSSGPDFQINSGTLWDGKTYYDLYQDAYTPWEWHEELFRVAKEEGLVCFSSPFDFSAVDFLENLEVPAYKIASFEITDIPLIRYTARKGKPVIISTGIADAADIELALHACRNEGNNQIVLLKCTSSYPAPIEEANLIMIRDLSLRYDVLAGLSDHTMGDLAPILSVAFGARIIEKHFILDRAIGGPDSAFSLNEQEFTQMVDRVREAELAIGKVDYSLTLKQQSGRNFSRSLYVVKDISTGETLTSENVRSIRPGYGLHPRYWDAVIGGKAKRPLKMGERLALEDVDYAAKQ